jgi:hypothetical protein
VGKIRRSSLVEEPGDAGGDDRRTYSIHVYGCSFGSLIRLSENGIGDRTCGRIASLGLVVLVLMGLCYLGDL